MKLLKVLSLGVSLSRLEELKQATYRLSAALSKQITGSYQLCKLIKSIQLSFCRACKAVGNPHEIPCLQPGWESAFAQVTDTQQYKVL